MWKIPEGEDETPDKRIVGNDYRYAPTFDDSSEKEAKIGATNAKGESVEDTFKTRAKDANANRTIEITGTGSRSSFVTTSAR